MKEKKVFVFGSIILIMLYFWGCSPIRRFLSSKGMSGIIAFLFATVMLSAAVLYLIEKYTRCFHKLEKWSASTAISGLCKEFQIERKDMIMLCIIVLIGAVLRFGGINWGITSIFQSDENNLLNDTIGMAMAKVPYQDVFKYPNQCVSKIAAVAMMIYGAITGATLDVNTIDCYFIYRGIVALFSTLTIITSFLIGNYLHKHMGVIVAALVALFPEYVNLSKQVTGDSTSFFFLTILLLGSLLYMERKNRFWLLAMSLATACATMEKWHAAVGCFYIAFIVIYEKRNIKEIIKEGSIALITYVGGMFLIAPNMFWNIKDAIGGVIYMYEYDADGVTPYGQLMLRYIGHLHCYIGSIGLITLVLGCMTIIKEHTAKYFVLLLGLIKLGALGFLNRGFPRWGLEFYFTVILVISAGLITLAESNHSLCVWTGRVSLGIIGCCFLLGSILVYIVAVRSDQDTRLQQEKFCAENEILREESIFDFYTGFDPGGIRDGREYGGRNLLAYELGEKDGELCLYMEGIKYAVDNIGYKDSEQTQMMRESCPLVAAFRGRLGDTFTNPVYNVQWSWTEIGLMRQCFEMLQYVWQGGATGPTIEIYDVSALPVCKE